MPELTPERFASRLEAIRLALGMTPEEMARDVGVTLRTYRKYAKGEGMPRRVDPVLTFCYRHGISSDYVLGKTEVMFQFKCPYRPQVCRGVDRDCPLFSILEAVNRA